MDIATTTLPLRADIDGNTFDYLVTVDGLGCIHEVRCSFFELPEVVQQLTLGQADNNTLLKIRNRGAIFQYELVLTLAGHLGEKDNPVWEASKAIQERLQAAGISWKEAAKSPKSSDIVWWFAQREISTTTKASSLGEEDVFINALLELLASQKEPTKETVEKMAFHGGTRGQLILFDFLPFLSEKLQELALSKLSTSINPQIDNLLIDTLSSSNNLAWIKGVLSAFSRGDSRGKTAAVIAYFNSQPEHDSEILWSIAKVLTRDRSEESKAVLLSIFRRYDAFCSREALNSLRLGHNYPTNLLADEVWAEITNEQNTIVRRRDALEILFGHPIKHLPPTKAIWQQYLKLADAHPQLNLCYLMSQLLTYAPFIGYSKAINRALKHPSPLVATEVVNLMSHLFYHSSYFIPKQATVATLMADLENKKLEANLDTLSTLASALAILWWYPGFIPRTIALYQKGGDAYAILRAWTRYFAERRYNPAVEPICFEILNSTNSHLHAVALEVLLYHPLRSRKRLLKKLPQSQLIKDRLAKPRPERKWLPMRLPILHLRRLFNETAFVTIAFFKQRHFSDGSLTNCVLKATGLAKILALCCRAAFR